MAMNCSEKRDKRSDRRRSTVWIALILALLLGSSLPVQAEDPPDLLKQANPAELEEFRADLELLALILDQQVGNQLKGPSLTERIKGLSEEELLIFFNIAPREGLTKAVDAMARSIDNANVRRRVPGKSVVGTNDAFVEPDYPSGDTYDAFVATLPGLGALSDWDGDGRLSNERCSYDYEAGLQIGIAVASVVSVVAQTACALASTDPTGAATTKFCTVQGVVAEIEVAIEIAIAQCEFQDSAVDTAEIEATYENTRILIGGLTCRKTADPRKGHGCDGQDANCNLIADECGEDVFGPDIDITGNMSARWFASPAEAAAAVAAATSAIDDCQRVTVQRPEISGTCNAALASVTATDACDNWSTATTPLRIDGQSPSIAIGDGISGSCHASVQAAELATLASISASDDCTAFGPGDIAITSAVSECSLRIRATVTDAAGHSASSAATVRVDTLPPRVEIERLLLGTHLPFCYAAAADATAAVFNATRFTDNCTPSEHLGKGFSSSGDLCALRVTSHAVDQCGVANTDSLTVRVDSTLPTVSCSVNTAQLTTNHEMVDVGFKHSAADNCVDLRKKSR